MAHTNELSSDDIDAHHCSLLLASLSLVNTKSSDDSKPKKKQKTLEILSSNKIEGHDYDSLPTRLTKALFSPKYRAPSNTADLAINKDTVSIESKDETSQKEMDWFAAAQHLKRCLWECAEEEVDAFLFMKYAPQIPDSHTLVLDLDETLVHCTIEPSPKPDIIFPVVFNGENYKVYMRKRPHFQSFLEFASKLFEVVVFTASQKCYANKLLDMVDPSKKYIHHRLFRDHCVQVEGNFVKDLRVIGRDLSKTIIVDNSPPAFTYQVDNGIPIVSWFDNDEDQELLRLIPILQKLKECSDVRPLIRKFFQTKKLLKQFTDRH
ncbi:nuclear lim interactor-interacting protein [Reticulomyxa filosa]|uniref:Nuclear lim interactor-interacting protein n=1 Tax=Reticulomyxa filosa TaxID=46433 RepID=X6N5B5_RETFI|nr:nuclear lim interactor-interacting protein [Reticulomyxa filosa]|eukprot:ETO21460.1 nuclear lim interactor-interacting protein [Reticulomyxa filosa]